MGEQTSVDNSGTPNVPQVVLTSGYDLMGDRTSLSATIAAKADFLNNYSYDGDQNLTQITQQGQTGGNGVATKGVNYVYNLAGQVTSQVDYTQLGNNPPAIVTGAFSYDNAGRLTGIDYTHSTTTLDNMTWTLDAAGRVEDFMSSVDGTAAYSYDNANQLLGATYTGNGEPPNESYSFDSNGNRSMTGYTTGTNNQTTSDGTYNYSYDADGNSITRTQISGTQNSDYKTTYSFDYRNRLTDVYDYNNSGTLTAHYHYVYDVWDNLIGEEIDPTGGGTYTSSRWYAWDVGSGLPIAGQPSLVAGPAGPGGIVAQFDGSGNLLVRYFDGPSPTLRTDAAFEVLGEEDIATQGAAGTLYFTALDNLGTLRDMIDTNGVVQDHLVYTAFGQIFSESNASIGHWQDFAFQHLDPNTGLAAAGRRVYDAPLGDWMQQDPKGFSAGDPNLARYAGNDPTGHVDPSGLGFAPPPPPGAPAPPPPPGPPAPAPGAGARGGAVAGSVIGGILGGVTVVIVMGTPVGWAGAGIILVGVGVGALGGALAGAAAGANQNNFGAGMHAAATDPMTYYFPIFLVEALVLARQLPPPPPPP